MIAELLGDLFVWAWCCVLCYWFACWVLFGFVCVDGGCLILVYLLPACGFICL